MKAYRIQNDIVAAHNPDEAIITWAEDTGSPINSAGPVEEVPPTLNIAIEDEDGNCRLGTVADTMPALESKSAQLTPGAKHYGITTSAATGHLKTMLGAEDWGEVTNFDRACIAEVLAWAEVHGCRPSL